MYLSSKADSGSYVVLIWISFLQVLRIDSDDMQSVCKHML